MKTLNFIILKKMAIDQFNGLDFHYKKIADEIFKGGEHVTSLEKTALAAEYLEENLNYREDKSIYRKKLLNLWFIVTGENRFKIGKSKTDLARADLPDGKAILDLITESGLEKDRAIQTLWAELLEIVALGCNEKDRYDAGKMTPAWKLGGLVFYFWNLGRKNPFRGRTILLFLFSLTGAEGTFNFRDWYKSFQDNLDNLENKLIPIGKGGDNNY